MYCDRVRTARLLAVAATLSPGIAWAEENPHAKQGDVAISIDRLLGISVFHWQKQDGQEDFVEDLVRISLVGAMSDSNLPSATGAELASATVPRIGLDGFVIDNLSVGCSFFFWSEIPKGPTTLLIGPRLGYLDYFSDLVGFWPRAGVIYFRSGPYERSGVWLSVEAPVLITPNESVAFTVGPVIDIPLNEFSDERGSYRAKVYHAGAMGGIALRW